MAEALFQYKSMDCFYPIFKNAESIGIMYSYYVYIRITYIFVLRNYLKHVNDD